MLGVNSMVGLSARYVTGMLTDYRMLTIWSEQKVYFNSNSISKTGDFKEVMHLTNCLLGYREATSADLFHHLTTYLFLACSVMLVRCRMNNVLKLTHGEFR